MEQTNVMKTCPKCKTEKPFTAFPKNKSSKDGLYTYCKECHYAILKTYQQSNREAIKKSVKKYQQTDRGKASIRAAIKKITDAGYYLHGYGAISRIKQGAKKRGLTVSLTEEEYRNWWVTTEDRCYYCNSSLNDYMKIKDEILKYDGNNYDILKYKIFFRSNIQRQIDKMTVDRVDNNIGYDLHNIVKACWICNSLKGDFFSAEDMKILSPKLIGQLQSDLLNIE